MKVAQLGEKLKARFANQVTEKMDLSRKSTFGTGGICDFFLRLGEVSEVIYLFTLKKKYGFPLHILGRGSNVLIADGCIPGVVLQAEYPESISFSQRERIVLPSAMLLSKALALAQSQNLKGLEFAAGIPATVGGAVKMNAGTREGEMGSIVESITVVDDRGAHRLDKKDIGFAYRQTRLPDDLFIQEVEVRLERVEPAEIDRCQKKVRHYLNYRKATQPLNKPTLGSTFVNPPGYRAAELIEDCGIKGHRFGGAEVSTHHANFLINTGRATSEDALSLIKHIESIVLREKKITLRREVRLLGFSSQSLKNGNR